VTRVVESVGDDLIVEREFHSGIICQRGVTMRKIAFAALFVFLACPVGAQEIFVSGGFASDVNMHGDSGEWSVSYGQDLTEHLALSISYINEGHQPNHYRDGIAPQIWGRAAPFDPRLSFALGAGPYLYFDTKVASDSDEYENHHGLGVIFSGTATWYGLSPFLLQVRANYIGVDRSFDSFSASFGIGWLLQAKPGPGEPPKAGKSIREADNEIGFFLGKSVLNSAKSEQGDAMSVEYRRRLLPYLELSAAWLNEGDSRPIGRSGFMSQLWLVRGFIDDRLSLGIGGGPYLARDKYDGDDGSRTTLAGAVSLMALYRFTPHLGFRGMFHRIVPHFCRDTDVFMGGLVVAF